MVLSSLAGSAFAASHGKDWQQLRKQISQTFHITPPLPSLEAKSFGKFSPAPGITADRVSYATAYGLRIPAIVYHQSSPTIAKHPALIVVNGHKGDKSSWYSVWAGILYARAGAVVLTYDPIGEYERNKERLSGTGEHDNYLPPDDMARRLAGLMIQDVMQGVSYLNQRRDVDGKRIAVLGYSMGSFVSSLACALDTRIHACVLAGGGDLDGPGGYWDTSNKMCQAIPYQSLKFLGERGPMIFALNAKRGPTLIVNGQADDVVDIVHHGPDWFEQLRKQTESQLGGSKDIFDVKFDPTGGHRPYFVTKPDALWLEEKLKFPNWTKKQIAALPETRVSDWALKHGLVTGVSHGYALNEGGTVALGDDMPAVPRDELHAVPDAVWQSDLESYIYETWVERAKAAIESGAP